MAMQTHCCLYRLGHIRGQEHECISLNEADDITIGRDVACDIVMTESKAVSRKHAKLTKGDGEWALTDLCSGNGVYVNNSRVESSSTVTLQDRDIIELGRDVTNQQCAAYRFQFFKKAKVQIERGTEKMRDNISLDRIRKKLCALELQSCSPSSLIQAKVREKEREIRESMGKTLQEKTRLHEQLVDEMLQLRLKFEAEQKEKEELLSRSHENHEMALRRLREDSSAVEKSLDVAAVELQREIAVLQEQREHEQDHVGEVRELSRDLEERLRDKEGELARAAEQYATQKASLQRSLEEKLKGEELRHAAERERLAGEVAAQREVMEALREQEDGTRALMREEVEQLTDKMQQVQVNLDQQLQKEAELNATLSQMEASQSKMAAELNATLSQLKASQSKMAADLERAKREAETSKSTGASEIVDKLEDLVETELVCAICSELFVQATSLGCSHSFCRLCIEKWLAQKNDCPQCRQPVKGQVPSLVLNNYIARLVDYLSDGMKQRRQQFLAERKREQEEYDSKRNTAPSSGVAPTRDGGGTAAGRQVAPPDGSRVQRPLPRQSAWSRPVTGGGHGATDRAHGRTGGGHGSTGVPHLGAGGGHGATGGRHASAGGGHGATGGRHASAGGGHGATGGRHASAGGGPGATGGRHASAGGGPGATGGRHASAGGGPGATGGRHASAGGGHGANRGSDTSADVGDSGTSMAHGATGAAYNQQRIFQEYERIRQQVNGWGYYQAPAGQQYQYPWSSSRY